MAMCKCGCNKECRKNWCHGHNTRYRKSSKESIEKRTKKVLGQKRPKLSEKRKGAGNPMFGKHSWNFGLTKEIDKRVFNNTQSMERKRKIGLASKKRIRTEQEKNKIREKLLQRIKERGYQNIGKNEKEILDKLEKELGYKIDRTFHIIGYKPDGYIKELNLIIEIDEKHHFDSFGYLHEKDIIRQNKIQDKLKCKFLRIKDEK